MDVGFYAERVHRQIPSVQSAEDEEGDEVGDWFPCPICYVEIEVPLFCVHLQEEDCFHLKNAVCPICAANLGKDPLGHFTMQHSHSIKRRKKSRKSGFWDSSSFFGDHSLAGSGSENEPAHDPLLSPFLCNVPLTVPKDRQVNVSSCVVATSDEQRTKPSPRDETRGPEHEEKTQRAAFVQDLLYSTIF